MGAQPAPSEELVRVYADAARDQTDRGARFQALPHHSHLIGGVPAPAPLHGGDELHLLRSIIAEVQTAEGKLYLFVAIDRTSKFAFAQLVDSATRVTASAFLEALVVAVPYRIHTVLTDNGIQFRLPSRYANGPAVRYLTHMFDLRCAEHGIEHRFTRINHP